MARTKVYVKKAPKAKRESIASLAERLYLEVIGIRAAILTTIIAIDDGRENSVMHAVSTNLHRAAMDPLNKVLTELAVRRG